MLEGVWVQSDSWTGAATRAATSEWSLALLALGRLKSAASSQDGVSEARSGL